MRKILIILTVLFVIPMLALAYAYNVTAKQTETSTKMAETISHTMEPTRATGLVD